MPNEFIARNGITSLGNIIVSGSITSTGAITISGSIASASFATTAATASSADNLLVRSTLTAQTLVVQTITSSVDFVTGSTRFGSIIDNTHQFTGSMSVSGSATFTSGLINGTTDAFFDINRSASSNAGRVRFQTTGSDEFEIGLKGGVAGFHITKGDATELVTVLTSGNVGIGTTPNTTAGITELAIGSSNTNPLISGIRDGVSAFSLSSDSGGTRLLERRNLELTIGTNNTTRLTISSTGAATFSSSITAGSTISTSTVSLGTDGTYGANYRTLGLTGTTNGTHRIFAGTGDNLYIAAATGRDIVFWTDGSSGTKASISTTGAATFADSITGNLIISNRTKSGAGVESWDGLYLRLFGSNAVGDSINIKFANASGTQIANIQGILGADNIAYGSLAFSTRNYFTDSMVEVMRISNRGNVLIGKTTDDGQKLQVNGAVRTDNVGLIRASSFRGGLYTYDAVIGSGTDYGMTIFAEGGTGNGNIYFCSGGSVTKAMTIATNGAVTIAGSLSKGSGSFRIKHPLASKKNTHQLVHSFIEGPQADLLYSGTVTLVNGKATINIDEAATMTEGTFEALCRNIRIFTSNETSWDNVRGKVIGNILTIESQNTESTDEISWLVIGERHDEHMMNTDWTDENGRVIVEPLAPEETTII